MSDVIPSRWTLIRKSDRSRYSWYRCSCPAGTVREVKTYRVKSGQSLSCGCYMREACGNRFRTHGKSGLRISEYESWTSMHKRCSNPEHGSYKEYGGRGIRVCDRWQGEQGFQNFLADMGLKPSPEYQIDRYPNNDGNYKPENCRWATVKEQARNRRSNVNLTYDGKTQCVAAWAEELGVSMYTLYDRLESGWSDIDILTRPIRKMCRRP